MGRSINRSWLGLVLLAGLIAWPTSAFAEDDETKTFSVGYEGMWYLMGGATGGGSFGSPGAGGFVGGELSFFRLKEATWFGLYADGAYDFGHSSTTLTAGPELGFMLFGLDGGPGLRITDEDQELGAQGRLVISLLGIFSIYGRYSFWPDSSNAKHVGQAGVLLKFPLFSPGGEPTPQRWQ